MIKECPNGCYVTDKDILRCPKCDKIMLKHSPKKTQDEVIDQVKQRQNAYRKDLR